MDAPSSNVHIDSKESTVYSQIFRPKLVIEYGIPIDYDDPNVNSSIYDFANVTDVDTLNNIFYIDNTTSGGSFTGSESNSAYTNIGADDGNYHRVASPTGAGISGIRFETKIDENASDILKIEINHKLQFNYSSGTNPMDDTIELYIYDNNTMNWISENVNTFGNTKYSSRKGFMQTVTYTIYITDNFDRYLDSNGVLKYCLLVNDNMGFAIYTDTYYYYVKNLFL
jgi:hypothetical protein